MKNVLKITWVIRIQDESQASWNVIAFSRNERTLSSRTHPKFVSWAREMEIFCEDCKLAAPLNFMLNACFLSWLLSLFSLTLFFTLITFHKKDNAVPLQTGVRFFGRPKTNYIIAKHVDTTRFVRDRSFLEVLNLDRAWPVWSGCEMTYFCYVGGTTLFILFTNTTLNHMALALGLTVGTAIFHWLYFDYIC